MHICNEGVNATGTKGDYSVRVLRGRSQEVLDKRTILKQGKVIGHSRLSLHVWHLVAKALASAGYRNGVD